MSVSNSEFGIQDDGSFRRKHIDDIIEDLERAIKNEVGEDIELRPSSPLKQIIDAVAIEVSQQWQAAEAAYYASFYADASGEALDKLLALAGFSRIPARSATGEVEFRRDDPASDDIVIDEETVVTTPRTETKPPIPFETTEQVVLRAGETSVTASIEAQKPWQTELEEEWLGEETNVGSGSITRFDDPVRGIDEVDNPKPTGDDDEGFVSGRDRESDPEFRLRYENTLAEGGVSTAPAIESSIYNWDEDIVSVLVDEVNDLEKGYGPEVTVLAPGVPDDEIAQAILESRAGGLESFGDESGTATDDGRERTERFNRAERVTVTVDVSLTVTDTFPENGVQRIEDEIIRYLGGVASDDIQYPGRLIGEDVVFDQVKRKVMEVRGVIQADVSIGTDPENLGSDNISIGEREAAMTDADEVNIET